MLFVEDVGNLSGCPSFCMLATVANILFVYRLYKVPDSNDYHPTALLVLRPFSLLQTLWTALCFIQCVSWMFSDVWAPQYFVPCQVQGFYMTFGTSAGQLFSVLIAWVSLGVRTAAPPDQQTVRRAICCTIAGAALTAVVPLVWGGFFPYVGCFVDWTSLPQVVAKEIVSISCALLAAYYYVRCAVYNSSWRTSCFWLLHALVYIMGYAMLIPAGFYGMLSDEDWHWPGGKFEYMRIAAFAIHSQWLLSVLLFGVLWRTKLGRTARSAVEQKDTLALQEPVVQKC